MNPLNRTLTCALVMCVIVTLVHGNGRLLVPPQRSSLWRDPAFYRSRYVFKNYDDHTLNCGGFWKMHENDGKCGLCGDPWDEEEPRPNEAGGIYGRGIIGRTYSTDKRFIDVVVQVTSSMGGYFEFNICPHNDVKTRVTKECLDEFPMRILSKDQTTSYGRRYIPDITAGRAGIVELALEIPDGMECTQCVLQWRWHGGNNYGICRNGQWGKGCGEQPEIYNCADIAILPDYKEEEPNGHKEIDMNGGRPWTPKPATRKPEITTPKAKESVTTTVASKLTTTAAPKTTARRLTTTAASTTTVERATDKPVNITTTPVERSTGKPVTTTTFLPEIIISTKMPERITTDKQEMSTNETLLVSTTERAAGKPITTTMLLDIITSTNMPESVTTDKQEVSTNDTLVSTTERAAGKPITTTMLPDINISTKMPERVTTEKQEISTNETLLVSTTESAKGKPITMTMLPDIIISTKLPERVTTEKQEIEISTNKTLLASTTVSLVNTETNVTSNTTQDAQESTSRQDMTTQLPTTTNTLTVNNNSTNLADRKDINTTIPSLLNITTANIETSTKQSDGQTEGEETSISPVSTSIPVVPVTASEKQQKETLTNSSTAANKPTTVTLEIPSTQFNETSTVIQVTEVVKQQTDISNNDTLAVNDNTTVKPQKSSAKSPNQETTQAINTTTKQALDLINAEVLTTNSVALQNSSTVPTTSVSTTVNETSDKITKSDKSEITTGQPTTMAFIQTNNQSTDSSNSQNNNQSTTTAVISQEKSSESTTTEQPLASVAVNGSDLEMTTPREVVTTPFISTNTSRQMLTGNSTLIVETTTDMANDGGSSVKPVSLNNATSTMNTTTPDVNILKNTPEGFGTTQQKLSSSSTVPLVTGSKLSTSTSTPTTSSTGSFTTTENSLISLLDDIANLADLKSNEILDFVNQTSGNNTSLAEDGKTMKSVSTVQTSSTDNTTTASPVSTNATDSSVFTSKTSVSRTTRLARPTGGRFGGGINVATLFPVDNIVNIDLNIPGGDANAEKQAVPAN